MKQNIILITKPELVEGETRFCNKLLAHGLQRLHLRKPALSKEQLASWIEEIEPCFHNRIVVHDHHRLAVRYGLGGIHLNSRNPEMPVWFDRKKFSLSCSCHSISEVEACQKDFDYVFLSPIFDSISKPGYKSAFPKEELTKARKLLSKNVYALGGVNFENLQAVQELGFHGAAMLGGFCTDIIFDLGGVLLDLNMQGIGEACKRLGINPELFFVKADEENTSTVCHGISASKAITEYQVGGMTSEEFLDLVLSYCGKGISRRNIIEAWNACIGPLPKERLDMIKQLRRKGYHTHLLSNTNDLHWEEIKRRFLSDEGYTCQELFDHVFVSHEMHLAKPDGEIYRQAVKQIGRPAAQCFFIDDALVNVEGARKEKLQGAWLDLREPDALKQILSRF